MKSASRRLTPQSQISIGEFLAANICPCPIQGEALHLGEGFCFGWGAKGGCTRFMLGHATVWSDIASPWLSRLWWAFHDDIEARLVHEDHSPVFSGIVPCFTSRSSSGGNRAFVFILPWKHVQRSCGVRPF